MPHPPGSGPFARVLDVHVLADSSDRYELAMDATEEHLNAGRIVHGGVLMSLLDMAMAGTIVRTLGPGERTASIHIGTHFLKAAGPGRLVARARLLRRGRTAAFPEGEIVNAEGELLARASGVWAISRAGGREAPASVAAANGAPADARE